MTSGKAVVLVVEDSPIMRMGALDPVLCVSCQALEARDAGAARGRH